MSIRAGLGEYILQTHNSKNSEDSLGTPEECWVALPLYTDIFYRSTICCPHKY